MSDHVCRFKQYSHTSYHEHHEHDVFLCTHPGCPAWDIGPSRPRKRTATVHELTAARSDTKEPKR